MSRERYNTESKNIILNCIKNINIDFTTKDIYDKLNGSVGLTTIYRFLDELEKEELVKKYYNDKNVSHYQYINHCDKLNHFYLKCNSCGKLIHVDCDCITDVQKHILDNHRFNIDNKNIIITGICEVCNGGK